LRTRKYTRKIQPMKKGCYMRNTGKQRETEAREKRG
jgi:hypothetical protein